MSAIYNFTEQQQEWSRPPVDDYGYVPADEMFQMPDAQLRHLILQAGRVRYSGWRNHRNLWRDRLGLDTTSGKRILDFGCGIGLEALQFAPRNEVIVADIVPESVLLAERVARIFGYEVKTAQIAELAPFMEIEPVDIFYCNGVLHHIPYAEEVLRWAAGISHEIRLMLYSDRGWAKYVGSPVPPSTLDVRDHPDFEKFVRAFDQVGTYADWYSAEKLVHRFGSFLHLKTFDYITNDDRYCVAIMEPRLQ